jgi:Sulfotransferase family
LIIIVRDPIDRGYSNGMHLWVDGLEPIANFEAAWRAEGSRVAAGWAPFWHYRRLGQYGEQLADLLGRVERERILVLRYWQVVSQPNETLNRTARFLGIADSWSRRSASRSKTGRPLRAEVLRRTDSQLLIKPDHIHVIKSWEPSGRAASK